MFGIGTTELLILAGVMMLLFGATRLPSMMRNMGRSVNEFKQGLRDEPTDVKSLEDKTPESKDASEKVEDEKEVANL